MTSTKFLPLHILAVAIIAFGLSGVVGALYVYYGHHMLASPLKNIQGELRDVTLPGRINVDLGIDSDLADMAESITAAERSLARSSTDMNHTAIRFKNKYYACQRWYSFLDARCWVADSFLDIGQSLEGTSKSLRTASVELGEFAAGLRSMGTKLKQISVPLNATKLDLSAVSDSLKTLEAYVSFLIAYLIALHAIILATGILLLLLLRKVHRLDRSYGWRQSE